MTSNSALAEVPETGEQQLPEKEELPQETLFSWLLELGRTGAHSLPQMLTTLLMQIGIVILIQLVFWWDTIAKYIPKFIKTPVIFLTATYNDVIPKTIYWVIIFTFGKKLVQRISDVGLTQALEPITAFVPGFKHTFERLSKKAYFYLLLGGGIGLVVANNFASYSRFSGARNKIDKYFACLLISFTVTYLLGEGRKHWIFKFSRLAASDISRTFKIRINYSDDSLYILLSGFVAGLLLDAPLILMHSKYGGYGLGVALIVAAIVTLFIPQGARLEST